MSLSEDLRNLPADQKTVRHFGITIGATVALIGAVLWYLGKPYGNEIMYVGAFVLWLAGFVPRVLKPLHRLWMGLALVLGWIMTRVLLSLVFYFVITPIGLARRLFGQSSVRTGPAPNKDSYWIPRDPKRDDPENLRRQF
jgi:multisubunit Na+/H+ antiporter MnhG subunit